MWRQLRVHADSRNLDDVLPAFDVASIPVKLQNGEAVFDGVVTGRFVDPGAFAAPGSDFPSGDRT